MKFNHFVDELSQRGVKLWFDAGQLRVRAPKGVLTPELRDLMAEYKAELLALVQHSNAIAIETELLFVPVSREGDLPLSFGQERLWFKNQIDPTNPSYNEFAALRLKGSLNAEALERSINEIIRRHELWRTTFREVDGQPIQIIASTLKLAISLIDLRQLPNDEREIEIQRLTTDLVHCPFDLAAGPLLRVLLLQLERDEHILILNAHHIICDGWSSGIFFRELAALYEAFCSDKPSPLPELTLQYADFAHWQRQWLQGLTRSSYLAYWKEKLQGAPSMLELPTDRPRPPVQTFRGAHQSMPLSKELSEALANLSKRENVSLFMTLLAAFQILLYRYTGQADICTGTPIANRNRLEIEGLIGFFVNTLVLRTDLSGNPSFLKLLLQVREVALGAYAHQDLPFEQLVEELQPTRSLSHTPLFSVMFVFHNVPLIPSELPGLTVSPFEVENFTAKLDLTLSFENTREGLIGLWKYNTDLFDAVTIARMAGHFQTLLEGIVANPDRRLSELPLLTAAERHQLLVEWNDTKAEYPQQRCVHQLFEAQVERTPDAVAVVFEDNQLTYRELNAKANQLAHYLQKLGVKPEVRVGICVDRSLEMMVGLLGILKAGGAYVPLDSGFPKQRLAAMIEDSQVPLLVTSSHLVDGLLTRQMDVVCLDTDWETIARESEQNPVSAVRVENLVYVIYTSGSTGSPKGVAIEHRQLLNYLHSIQQILNVPNASFATVSTFAADLGNTVIFPALCGGGCLHIISQERATDPKALAAYFRQHAIDCLKIVPSHLKALLAQTASILPRKRLILGGEALSWELVEKVWKYAPDCLIFNHYGPTETTVGVLTYQVKRGQVRRDSQTVPLGRPISNTEIYILDSHFQPVPVGTAGELYIGGAGLGRGYLNRPDLTQEKFIPYPFSNNPDSRLYKTGDRARYLPDGNIEFLGRTDNQVKIRGFRIELGEIESLLAQHPDVRAAIVIAREDTPGDKRLVAYVVPKQEPAPTWSDLRRFLQEQVPEYMVPAAFVILEALPLTANGKVDRRSLPAMNTSHLSLETTSVPPRSHLEMQLVQIWEDVLNVYPLGVRDCFFERGGHSLLAVRLMALIQQQFGKYLPLASLFQNSTIEHQASLVLQQTDCVPFSPLVAIQAAGTQPPFFCVHPVGGNVLCYFELARHLGKEQPFYGLQSAGLNGEQEPKTSIEDMAAHYIEALQAIQPSGPYYLGGWSLGGIVAFEMAQQLRDRGEEVALLALIDSYAPAVINWYEDMDEASLLVHLARDMGGLFGKELPISADELQQFPPEEQLNYILERSKNLNILPPEVSLEQMRHLMRVFQANREAMLSYIPQPYPGKMALLSASSKPLQVKLDPTQGWGELATHGLLDIQPIPGDHYAILRAPHVQLLAQQLATYLKSGNQ
ncbi:amino acid adenylation domain-containing protein [Microcoleus sp. N3A4]|uniref:amino acid adenylation domain-containing protein n=1 Tax=Microcoleus sp. N3A4 TaxID=3055379 RepID=UPI002FD49DE9